MGADQIPRIIDDAGFIDGEHWYALEVVFKEWAKRHNRPRAISTAERMAATVDDIVPDLMMVASGIVEAEWDEGLDNEGWDRRAPRSGRPSTACASGSPRGISRRTQRSSSSISSRGSLVCDDRA
jgi:hypothetical protein